VNIAAREAPAPEDQWPRGLEIFPEMKMTVAGLDRLTGITGPDQVAGDDERTRTPRCPRGHRRRTFTAQYKQEIRAAYDAAPGGEKGSILRREGLYSSLITEWRLAHDAGALAGLKQPQAPCGGSAGCADRAADQGES
jgi:hypothetical protein